MNKETISTTAEIANLRSILAEMTENEVLDRMSVESRLKKVQIELSVLNNKSVASADTKPRRTSTSKQSAIRAAAR